MASMMSLAKIFNASVGSTEVLITSGIGEVISIMVVVNGAEGLDTVDLMPKVGERFVGSVLPVVVSGTRVASGIYVVFFLEVMEY